MNKQYNIKRTYIDDGGMGAPILDFLLETEVKRKVEGINNASRSIDRDKKHKKLLKEDLYANLLRLMEQGHIHLLNDPEVFMSLESVQYEYENNRVKIFGRYTHIAEALIRAAWCTKAKDLNIFLA